MEVIPLRTRATEFIALLQLNEALLPQPDVFGLHMGDRVKLHDGIRHAFATVQSVTYGGPNNCALLKVNNVSLGEQ